MNIQLNIVIIVMLAAILIGSNLIVYGIGPRLTFVLKILGYLILAAIPAAILLGIMLAILLAIMGADTPGAHIDFEPFIGIFVVIIAPILIGTFIILYGGGPRLAFMLRILGYLILPAILVSLSLAIIVTLLRQMDEDTHGAHNSFLRIFLPILAPILIGTYIILYLAGSRRTFVLKILGFLTLATITVGILVPNMARFRYARGYERVRGDQAHVMSAIEAYYVDHHSWPPMHPLRNLVHSPKNVTDMKGDALSAVYPGGAGLAGITTPVAYQTQFGRDPYTNDRMSPFAYHTDGKSWILFSPGPDSDYDIRDPASLFTSGTEQLITNARLLSYNPTNGTVSSGDMWRIRQ